MGGLPEVVVGMDANMPCIGLAIIVKTLRAAVRALKLAEARGIGLSEPFYTREGLCMTAVVDLPWYVNPVDYMRRRMVAYLKRYAPDIASVRRQWRSLEWRPLNIPVIEGDALMPAARRILASYNLPPKLPAAVAEDLEYLLRAWGRRWRRSYNWAFKVATGKIFAVLSRLSRSHTMLVKLEDLGGMPSRLPPTRRWPHSRLLKLVHGNLPRAWIALVNPRGTSKRCPKCRGRLRKETYRHLKCTKCGREWHRDEAAAVNVALADITRVLRPPLSPMNRGSPGRGESGDEAHGRRRSPDDSASRRRHRHKASEAGDGRPAPTYKFTTRLHASPGRP